MIRPFSYFIFSIKKDMQDRYITLEEFTKYKAFVLATLETKLRKMEQKKEELGSLLRMKDHAPQVIGNCTNINTVDKCVIRDSFMKIFQLEEIKLRNVRHKMQLYEDALDMFKELKL